MRWGGRLLAALSVAAFVGCVVPPKQSEPRLSPEQYVERLRSIHANVDFAGSVTLADFQSTEQTKWFRVVGPDGRSADLPAQAVATLPGTADPLYRGLFTPLHEAARAVFDLRAAQLPGRPADWRDFGTLTFSLNAAPVATEMAFAIVGDEAYGSAWVQPLQVAAGWNHIRIDLDAVARQFDLAHVRSLEWRMTTPNAATTIGLFDIVLADRTTWLLGREATAGQLYACSHGQRLLVGARGQFGLVFVGGVIVGWYGDAPSNLTVRTGLGPWPISLPQDWTADPAAALARAVAKESSVPPRARSQAVVEASALRVIVDGGDGQAAPEHESGNDDAAPETPRRHWRYTIYADGRVFVQTTYDAPVGSGARVGYMLTLAGGSDIRLAADAPVEPDSHPAPFVLASRAGPPAVDLLWTCATQTAMTRRRPVQARSDDPFRIVVGDLPAEPTVASVHLLRFGPSNPEASDAASVAADYQNPVVPRPLAGSVVTDTDGDLDQDGYNESAGTYEMALERGILRVRFDPGELTRATPLFRVHGSTGQRCWAYVDGEVLPAAGHDAAGELLFVLPGSIRTPRLLEVYTQPAAPAGE